MKHLILLLFLWGALFKSNAQQKAPPSPILFIYDASGSMWADLDGQTKKEIASSVLIQSVNTLPKDQNIGLMAYGHRLKGDCRDVEFLLELNNNSKERITDAVKSLSPLGKTPLAYSAELAFQALKSSKTKATIILITDGIESCDGNICDVVSQAKSEGVDFKFHIVGFGLLESETEQLKCAANAGDGIYYDAKNASGLSDVLIQATSETIDESPGNFTVFAMKNNVPVDALVKAFTAGSTEMIDAVRTYGDTAALSLPQGKYDLVASIVNNSKIKDINVNNVLSFDDKTVHQTFSFDGGKVNVTALNNKVGWDCTVKVLDKNGKQVGTGRTYGKSKMIELNAGTYDIEIEALKINGLQTKYMLKDIIIESGQTKEVSHSFKTGIAKIGVQSESSLVDATINIKDKKTGKHIAAGRSYTSASSNPKEFILNPGIYEVTVKTVKHEYAGKSKNMSFEVKQNETVELIVNF